MKRRSVSRIAAAACLLACALPGAASAVESPTWLIAPTLNGDNTHQSLASMPVMDSDGNAWVFWLGIDPATSNFALLAKTRSAGTDAWDEPEVVSTGGAATAQFGAVALPNTELAAAWVQNIGGLDVIVAATRDASGTWSSPETLSDASQSSSEAALVADTAGNLTAVWRCGGHVIAARRPVGGSWGAPQSISDSNQDGHLGGDSVVAAPSGDVAVLWESGSNAVGSATFSGGAWQPSELFTRATNPDVLRLRSDANGNFFAAWHEGNFGQGQVDVVVMRRAAGASSWDTPEAISPPGGFALVPEIAGLPNGDVVVVWTGLSDTYAYVAKTRVWSNADHTWSPETQLFDDGWGAAHMVALPDGDVVASISHVVAGEQVATVVRRDGETGSWSVPSELPGSNSAQQSFTYIAADAAGNAVVAWDEEPSGGASHRAHAAIADGAGPLLKNLAVPSAGVVGEELTFSVSPFDLWSPLGSTSWDFGDGHGSASTATTHTFNAPGEYAVTVESSDLTGRASSATRVVTISPAPASEQPDTPPVTGPKPPVVLAPVFEARLAGRKITLQVKMQLRKGRACRGKAYATTTFGTRTYRATLKLGEVAKSCVAKGTITLAKTPSTRTRLKIAVRSANTGSRTLTTRRD